MIRKGCDVESIDLVRGVISETWRTYAEITQLVCTAGLQQVLIRVTAHDVNSTAFLLDAVEDGTLTRPTTHVALRHGSLVADVIAHFAFLLRALLLGTLVFAEIVFMVFGGGLFAEQIDVMAV